MFAEGSIQSWDERRDLIVTKDKEQAIAFSAEQWIHSAMRSIQQRGRFAVALSGGSTPKEIYHFLASHYQSAIDWGKVWLFWSDERAVPPNHPESNYKMAMQSFQSLPIPPSQILRMKAEQNIEQQAADYEDFIQRTLGPHLLDLVMLGIGEDGHTASLFPRTTALQEQTKLVVANFLPDTNQWRMTFTYPCIHRSAHATIYAIGAKKQAIVPLALQAAYTSPFPISSIGSTERKALWILDRAAAHLLPISRD